MGKRSANGVCRARQLQMDDESPNGERFDDGTLSAARVLLAVQICYCRKTNTVLGEKDGNREGRREGSRGAEGGAAALKIQRWFHALGPDKRPVGRSVGVGVGVGRCEGGHALASIPYNQRRRFSKETRYRTRVRFTITYPTRSIPAIVGRTIVGRRECGFRTPILAPSSNGTRISSVARERDKGGEPKKDSLGVLVSFKEGCSDGAASVITATTIVDSEMSDSDGGSVGGRDVPR